MFQLEKQAVLPSFAKVMHYIQKIHGQWFLFSNGETILSMNLWTCLDYEVASPKLESMIFCELITGLFIFRKNFQNNMVIIKITHIDLYKEATLAGLFDLWMSITLDSLILQENKIVVTWSCIQKIPFNITF